MPDDATDAVLLVDEPLPRVRRLTMNRPAKRNALNDALRGALFDELRRADRDRNISVIVIRGAGPCFSAGYDLGSPNTDVERAIAKADGWWSRHVVNNWFEMWDMSTPIIGQVHGWCLAGGTELAADGRGHVPHLEPVVDDMAAPPTVGLCDCPLDVGVRRAEVVPRREARAGAADHNHRNVAITVSRAELVE